MMFQISHCENDVLVGILKDLSIGVLKDIPTLSEFCFYRCERPLVVSVGDQKCTLEWDMMKDSKDGIDWTLWKFWKVNVSVDVCKHIHVWFRVKGIAVANHRTDMFRQNYKSIFAKTYFSQPCRKTVFTGTIQQEKIQTLHILQTELDVDARWCAADGQRYTCP